MAKEEKAVTTASVMTAHEQQLTVQSQAAYKGDSHFDLVEVTIVKDGKFYKEGQKDFVHPATAAILEHKGLIEKGWEKKVVERQSSDPLLDRDQVDAVLEGERDINKPASKK